MSGHIFMYSYSPLRTVLTRNNGKVACSSQQRKIRKQQNFTAFVHLSILHVTPIPDRLKIPCNRLVRIVKYMLHDGCNII